MQIGSPGRYPISSWCVVLHLQAVPHCTLYPPFAAIFTFPTSPSPGRIPFPISRLSQDKEDKENLHRSATPTPYASGANIPREASVLKPKNLWGNASPRSRPDSPTCAAENAAPGGTRGERERETAKEAVDGGTWRGAAGRVFLQEDETANSGRAYPTGTGRGQGAAPPESVRYSLRAVVRHVGATLSAGHFVADARCDGREWVRFDDARVEALGASEAEMPSSTSYVLVYVHDSVDG